MIIIELYIQLSEIKKQKQLRRKRQQNIENTSSKMDFKMEVHFHAVELIGKLKRIHDPIIYIRAN